MALRVGMTIEQYYDDDPELFEIYAKKYKIEADELAMRQDSIAWMHGYYVMKAVQQSLSTKKKQIYPNKPELVEGTIEKNKKKKEEASVMKSYSNFLAAVLNNGMTLQ